MTNESRAFGEVLDTAMKTRHLTLSALRERLLERGHPLSLATLSYWRSGHRLPARRTSLDALPDLEGLLGLDPGELSALVTRGTESAPRPFDELLGAPARAPITGEDDVSRVLFHLVVDVGAQRQIVRAAVRQVYVATRDGADGVTLFVGPSNVTGMNDVKISAVAGCSIGEVQDRESNIRSTRLFFQRPLLAGESVATEIEATTPDDDPDLDTDYGLVAEQKLEEAMTWVRFHPEALPRRVWVFFDEDGLSHEWEVDLAGASDVHYRQDHFGPGALGVRWEW